MSPGHSVGAMVPHRVLCPPRSCQAFPQGFPLPEHQSTHRKLSESTSTEQSPTSFCIGEAGCLSVCLLSPSLPPFLGRLHDQMVKINQSLHRLQVAWREAQQSSSPAADSLREQFERLMTIYLSTKTAMTEPQMLQNCLNLQVSMAVLLVQLAVGNHGTEPLELTFPLPEVEHSALAYVPGEATGPAGGLCQHLPYMSTGRAA